MINRIWQFAVDQWHCMYGCGFTGTYDEVKSHEWNAHPH
jgi:hypothetical protein